MEVKLNTNVDPVGLRPADQTRKPPTPPASDSTAFDHSAELNRALQETLEVRPEAVARGRELLQNTNYPPPELIRRLSVLLAVNLSGEDQ